MIDFDNAIAQKEITTLEYNKTYFGIDRAMGWNALLIRADDRIMYMFRDNSWNTIHKDDLVKEFKDIRPCKFEAKVTLL